jgi:para-aminobenzoate synthetase component I
MRAILEELPAISSPEALFAQIWSEPGAVLLRSASFESSFSRYSIVTARPFLEFRCWGAHCELTTGVGSARQFGNPWTILDRLLARYESLEHDLPFPIGGCFGFWGYDLKHFVEPKLVPRAVRDIEVPDATLFFCGSLVVFDHFLGKTFVIATGLAVDGSSQAQAAAKELDFWKGKLHQAPRVAPLNWSSELGEAAPQIHSNFSQNKYLNAVGRAGEYIRAGDIYQVNLSQRFSARSRVDPWRFFLRLSEISPAPYAAFINAGQCVLVSSSPELFLLLNGRRVLSRPIKGTRPRSTDPTRDAQLTYELQTSAKELSELVMITDLLRNDLGKICQFGSVHVPELIRLERYPFVQHLVSTVEGSLRAEVSHLEALRACFPGGSITGAPKFRAMEIIEELESSARGPYTGALGYIGFNRESQLSIIIRTALFIENSVYFQSGAGIVADSDPQAEYAETLAKAGGFFRVLREQANVPEKEKRQV